jgi:hypothetical protein
MQMANVAHTLSLLSVSLSLLYFLRVAHRQSPIVHPVWWLGNDWKKVAPRAKITTGQPQPAQKTPSGGINGWRCSYMLVKPRSMEIH